MRPPRFWNAAPDRPGPMPRLLAPMAWLYGAETARRVAHRVVRGYRAAIPVICVGNLDVGGTGKTPAVMALIPMLDGRRGAVHVVTRGYRGRMRGPVRVDPRRHTAAEVGDEPLLLAAFAPTWVARDRAAGVRAAEAAGAGIVVLDDGFQNAAVQPDFALLVVDAARGFGNGRVIPAGPLREPVAAGLARAEMVLSIGETRAQAEFSQRWASVIGDRAHLRGRLAPLATGMSWEGVRVHAFAGIGHPEKFFATLRALGADLRRADALSDHQPLTRRLLTRMELEAKAMGAQLVTTEKDAVRLPAHFRHKVLTLPVRLTVENPHELEAALDSVAGPRADGVATGQG